MPTTKVSNAYNSTDFMVVNNGVRMLQDDLRNNKLSYDGIVGFVKYLRKVPKRDKRTGQGLRMLEQGMTMWWNWLKTHVGIPPVNDEGGRAMIQERNKIFQNATNLLGESLGRREGFDPHNISTRALAIRKAEAEGYHDGYDDGIEACLDFKKDDDKKDKKKKKSLPVRHGEFTHSQAIQFLRQFVALNRSVLFQKKVPAIQDLQTVIASLQRLVENDFRVVSIINKIKGAIRSLGASQSFAASGRPMADYNSGRSRGIAIAQLRDSIEMADKLAKEMEHDEKWDAIGKPKPQPAIQP